MYLALIPTDETKEAIQKSVLNASEDLHLTLIFSANRVTPIEPKEFHEFIPPQYLTTDPRRVWSATVQKLDTFGLPDKRSWVFQLAEHGWLLDLRRKAEAILKVHGIGWQRDWPFSPHVTVYKGQTLTLLNKPPTSLRFERAELRR